MYIQLPCARRAHRNPPTYIHPPIVGMLYPILTYIYIQLTYTPQIIGIIYPIQIYVLKNVDSPPLCPKGTQKPSNLHSSPNCWHDISNTNINIQLTVVDVPFYTWCGGCLVWWMSGVVDVLFYLWCGGCLVWWMSGVVDVRCGGCLVWWMSYFTHSVVDVWCGGCLVWWMSYFTHGVVDVWCGGCLVWWMSGVVDVRCGGCLILHTVWWMSGVVDVCVVDVVQSVQLHILKLNQFDNSGFA